MFAQGILRPQTDARRKGRASVTLQRTVSDRSFRRPSGRGCGGDRWVAHLLGAPKWEYRHERKVVLGSEDHAHLAMSRVHRVTSLLDRWWLARIGERIARNSWITFLMSLHSASTDAPPVRVESCPADWCNNQRRSPSHRIKPSWVGVQQNGNEVHAHYWTRRRRYHGAMRRSLMSGEILIALARSLPEDAGPVDRL
jgi:hypothetical protein